MVPEVRLLKKMAAAAVVVVPLLSLGGMALGGPRVGFSAGIGAAAALGLLALSAGSAALFGKSGERMVPASYAVGFFVKMGLVTGLLYAMSKAEATSLVALGVSMGVAYLVFSVVGVLGAREAAGSLGSTLAPSSRSGER